MSNTRHTKVLIIGSGPAGYTAGVYASRAMLNPILVQGIEPGGQLTTTTEVENWPGDSEVQGPDLMIRMQDHAKAMGTEIIGDIITDLDVSERPFKAQGDSGTLYTCDAVILATGARAKWLGPFPLVPATCIDLNLCSGLSSTFINATVEFKSAL